MVFSGIGDDAISPRKPLDSFSWACHSVAVDRMRWIICIELALLLTGYEETGL
jgi:hypothetical protein